MALVFKNTDLAIRDVDAKQGIVVGYFASFDTKDAHNDVFVRGAFKKSIQENFKRIKHLKQHDPMQPIGQLLELQEDNIGLLFKSKISKATFAQDVLLQYEEGIYTEHSVGISLIADKIRKEGDVSYLLEVKLYEGSTVLWGANENTPVLDIKSEFEIQRTLEFLEKALKIQRLSDKTLHMYETLYHSLKKRFEPQPHSDESKLNDEVDTIKNIVSRITQKIYGNQSVK